MKRNPPTSCSSSINSKNSTPKGIESGSSHSITKSSTRKPAPAVNPNASSISDSKFFNSDVLMKMNNNTVIIGESLEPIRLNIQQYPDTHFTPPSPSNYNLEFYNQNPYNRPCSSFPPPHSISAPLTPPSSSSYDVQEEYHRRTNPNYHKQSSDPYPYPSFNLTYDPYSFESQTQDQIMKRQRRQVAGSWLMGGFFQRYNGGGGGGTATDTGTSTSYYAPSPPATPSSPGKAVAAKKPPSTAQPRPRIFVIPRGIGPVYHPNINDVLCGRGGRINAHQGNIYFRELVSKRKKEYLDEKTKKLEKAHIAADVVYQIRNMYPPGRFLKQDPDGSWFDIGDQKAIRKVGQTLRDDASDAKDDSSEGSGTEVQDSEGKKRLPKGLETPSKTAKSDKTDDDDTKVRAVSSTRPQSTSDNKEVNSQQLQIKAISSHDSSPRKTKSISNIKSENNDITNRDSNTSSNIQKLPSFPTPQQLAFASIDCNTNRYTILPSPVTSSSPSNPRPTVVSGRAGKVMFSSSASRNRNNNDVTTYPYDYQQQSSALFMQREVGLPLQHGSLLQTIAKNTTSVLLPKNKRGISNTSISEAAKAAIGKDNVSSSQSPTSSPSTPIIHPGDRASQFKDELFGRNFFVPNPASGCETGSLISGLSGTSGMSFDNISQMDGLRREERLHLLSQKWIHNNIHDHNSAVATINNIINNNNNNNNNHHNSDHPTSVGLRNNIRDVGTNYLDRTRPEVQYVPTFWNDDMAIVSYPTERDEPRYNGHGRTSSHLSRPAVLRMRNSSDSSFNTATATNNNNVPQQHYFISGGTSVCTGATPMSFYSNDTLSLATSMSISNSIMSDLSGSLLALDLASTVAAVETNTIFPRSLLYTNSSADGRNRHNIEGTMNNNDVDDDDLGNDRYLI